MSIMKRYFLIIVVMISFVIACNDNFTEVPTAKGVLTEENLTKDGNFINEGLRLLLPGAYAVLYGNNVGDPWLGTADNWWYDVLTDDSHKGSDGGDQPSLEEMRAYTYNTASGYFQVKWETLISGVTSVNEILRKAGKTEGIEDIIAEARFLRGHFNFELQRSWDKVPYISETDSTTNVPNLGDIWSEIEADFEFAMENLPTTQSEVARPTSWTAKAYLAKVLLQQKKYTEAIPVFTDIINNGPYELNPEFLTNFTMSGENSLESVFSIQFTSSDGAEGTENGNLGATLTHPNGGPYSSCCGFYQPTQDLVNAFQTDANGLPLLDTYNQTDVENDLGIPDSVPFTVSSKNLDPRLDYTVGRRGIDFNGFGPQVGASWIRDSGGKKADGPWSSGPYISKKGAYKKSELGEVRGSGPWGQQASGQNYNLIRYADVLLMAAEAEAEAGDISKAKDYVNEVRNRAKNMTYVRDTITNYVIEPYTSFPDKDFAIKAIRHERRLELAMEGHRFFDLKRYGSIYATDIIEDFISNEKRTLKAYKSGTFDAKHLTLPVPLSAIDVSAGILKQNDAWK